MPLSYDDYDRRRMMGMNPFDSSGRGREPRIEIREPDEGRITVEIQDMNTGYRYCKEFTLSYNHNRGHRNFGQGIMGAAEKTPNKGIDKKLILLL